MELDSGRNQSSSADRHLIAVGIFSFLGYLFLAFYSRGTFGDPNLVGFFTCIALVGLPAVGLFTFATRQGREFSITSILFWATLLRLCGLIGVPLFEDDYFRYLWDGYRFAMDGTPYGTTPFDFFDDPSVPQSFQLILNGINYPDLPTIYGPTTEVAFLIAYWLSPGKLVGLQLILIFMDVALIWFMRTECSSRFLFLYAFCPLVIKEIAFTAHPEAIGILCLVGAVMCRKRNAEVPLGILLGLAIGARVFAWILVPFLLLRTGWKAWVSLAVTLGLLYIPFVLQGATEFETLSAFARHWEFNSLLYGMLSQFAGSDLSRLVMGVLLVCGITLYFVKYYQKDYIRNSSWRLASGLFATSFTSYQPLVCCMVTAFCDRLSIVLGVDQYIRCVLVLRHCTKFGVNRSRSLQSAALGTSVAVCARVGGNLCGSAQTEAMVDN